MAIDINKALNISTQNILDTTLRKKDKKMLASFIVGLQASHPQRPVFQDTQALQ